MSVSASASASASSSTGGGGYGGTRYNQPIPKPLSVSEARIKRAQEASELRDRARKYMETIPWIASLMHNETLLDLAQKHGFNNTAVESDVSFLEERLDAQVFEVPFAARARRLETLRELDKYVRDPPTPWSSLAGKSRVYLVCVEGLSTDAIGLVCSLLDVNADALALHLVSPAPLHYSLPSSIDARPSMLFEYMSLVESSILTKKMSFSLTSYESANSWTAVFLLKNSQTLDYRAERSLEFYLRQPRPSTSMGTPLSFPAAFTASLQETIRLAGEDRRNRQTISDQFVHCIVEAVYPVIISECTAVLDHLNKELNHNRSVLDECGDGSCLQLEVREQKLKDARPRTSSFYDVQHDILNSLLRNLHETTVLFRSLDEENVGPGMQRQQREQQDLRIQKYRVDINMLISHTEHFRRDNDQFTQQRQAILDTILPPDRPISPAARYVQNRLDQIVFSTNPLLSLTFIATVFGMNLDIFVDGGLVMVATYLITAFVFAFVVFCVTFFYKPVIFWIQHLARGRETIVPRIDLKAGRREDRDEKRSKKVREIV